MANTHPAAELFLKALKPPERVDLITWAEKHMFMPSRETSTAGPYRMHRTPYWRHWADIISARCLGPRYMADRDPYAHLADQVWILKGRQVGGTLFAYIIMSYLMDQYPGPMGFYLPKRRNLVKHQNRLKPLVEASDRMMEHLPKTASRQREDINRENWLLDTMTLYWKTSSIADELRSEPVRWQIFDEFDLNPQNVGGVEGDDESGEGDAIDTALNAAKTFQGLAFGVTTPTHVENPGWLRLISGSHERLFVECQGCGASVTLPDCQMVVVHPDYAEPLTTEEAIAAGIDSDEVKTKDLGAFRCPHCGNTMRSRERDLAVMDAGNACKWVAGDWVLDESNPTGLWTPWADFGDGHVLETIHPPETTIRTGWLPTHYSRQVTVGEFVAEEMRIATRGRHGEAMSYRNNWHALPTIPAAVAGGDDVDDLRERLGLTYEVSTIPKEVRRILITCDQQGNQKSKAWFPYVVRGYGEAGESWLIEEGTVHGFDELDRLSVKKWRKQGSNTEHPANIIAVDANNAFLSVEVQKWCQRDTRRRFCVAGRQNLNKVFQKRSQTKKKGQKGSLLHNVTWYYVRTFDWKTMLKALRDQDEGAPGWHLPSEVSDTYLASLDSEHIVERRDSRGRMTYIWLPRVTYDEHGNQVERRDNHWWDAEYYNLALASILGWDDLKPDNKPRRKYGVISQGPQ